MNIGPAEVLIVCGISLFFLILLIGAVFAIRLIVNQSKASEVSDLGRRVPCPYCAELILPDAKICRFCGKELVKKAETP